MSTTLYRKYRPATFSEVIGQKHVVKTLQNAIKSGRIGQAYLFAGPRGTGKTSIARIFAKTINCAHLKSGEPCLKCDSCKTILDGRALDIIEIDAASHTGVDNIRELKETVQLPPSALKYKIYIIDEVHMLSGGAFNALLKTLEEPPEHVIFILATTEVHKIPETILSRVQRFDFTRLTVEEIIKRLEEISKLEKVKVDREALEIIATSSEGGMRNAESLLGQIIALEDKRITTKEVEFLLGTISEKELVDFVGAIIEKNIPAAFSKIGALREAGVDFKNFGKSLLNYLRQMLVLKINPELGKKLSYELTKERLEQINDQINNIELAEILDLINILQENIEKFRNSPIPQLFLEVSLAKTIRSKPAEFRDPTPKREIAQTALPKVEPSAKKKTDISGKQEVKETAAKSENKSPGNSSEDFNLIVSQWTEIIESLKSYNHSLSSVLKMSQPALIDGKYLILKTKYSFYNDKISDTQNRLTIEKAIDKITGVNLRLKAVTEKDFSAQYPDFKEKKSLLQEAVDIFGGKIVKE
ncbi:MAG: DNA polymerase III, subunit gamma and tau [Candidatus Moranbacteria bacterium RIFOXYB1_FULL_43_19]|nr:MAG: DNA polymerase III, subunit gamma and tau [Candidatus Moranbacteria bacterium RIFOXYB1_FULL_43_19]OGI33685.1 MAG: DNA polymerase III, subunit gamma and tau [Candidatus Moranbacteria bacterium RIFOXYC1_FULL_44_13]OGI37226.1 MAG: DNA polymerase III, subunit gamma and tau [Candidatus Moranbacteria bacterium RIFOXYD1_FULL_44_12]